MLKTREYTIKNFVMFHLDPETDFVMQCYKSQRIQNLKKVRSDIT